MVASRAVPRSLLFCMHDCMMRACVLSCTFKFLTVGSTQRQPELAPTPDASRLLTLSPVLPSTEGCRLADLQAPRSEAAERNFSSAPSVLCGARAVSLA